MSKGVSSKITCKPYNQREQWLLPSSLEELVPDGHYNFEKRLNCLTSKIHMLWKKSVEKNEKR